MKKSVLKTLMKEHCIVDCELEDVIDFVSDLLEAEAKHIEQTEPYATVTIDRLNRAAYEVYNLHDTIVEMEIDE